MGLQEEIRTVGEDHLPPPRADSSIQVNLEVLSVEIKQTGRQPVLARRLLCSNSEPMSCAVLSTAPAQDAMFMHDRPDHRRDIAASN